MLAKEEAVISESQTNQVKNNLLVKNSSMLVSIHSSWIFILEINSTFTNAFDIRSKTHSVLAGNQMELYC